ADRLAKRRSPADEESHLGLVVEHLSRTESRSSGIGGDCLAFGPRHLGAADHDRRSASMGCDWNVCVVWQQWIVGTKELADVGRVIDGCVEVGVVADRG